MTLDEALNDLLGPDRSGSLDEQLDAALAESVRRREHNSTAGGRVIKEMHARGRSYRGIESVHHLPRNTAFNWAKKLGAGDDA